MENQNNLQDLEYLRSQVAEFKNRLDQQEIVSRHLFDEAMKGHVSWIKHMGIWGGILDLAIVPFVIYAFRSIVGVSWLPIIVICLVLVIEGLFSIWNVSTIRDKYLAADNVISTQQRLRSFKRRDKLNTLIIYPFFLLWTVWLLFDVYYGTGVPFPSSTSRIVVDIVAIALAIVFSIYIFTREMHSLNKAIKEIEEFKKHT